MAAVFPRRLSAVIALLIAASVLWVGGVSSPAMADPDEGGSKTLTDALESAAKGQAEAIQKLNASKKRQIRLQDTVKTSQASDDPLRIVRMSDSYGLTGERARLLRRPGRMDGRVFWRCGGRHRTQGRTAAPRSAVRAAG